MTYRLNYIWTLLMIGIITACSPQSLEEGSGNGGGTARLELKLSMPARSAITVKDNTLEYFENIMVLLVDNQNIIKGKKIIELDPTSQLTEKLVSMDDIALGHYMLYAYANDTRLTGNIGGKFDPDMVFKRKPEDKGNYSLLTGKQPLTIHDGANSASVKMEHPLSHFRMLVFNRTPYQLRLKSLSFGNFNASQSYVVSHDGKIPEGTVYTALPPYTLQGDEQLIPANNNPGKEVYNTFLYENMRPNEYHYTMGVEVMKEATRKYTLEPAKPAAGNTDYTISVDEGYFLYSVSNKLMVGELRNEDFINIDERYRWEVDIDWRGTYFRRRNNNDYYIFFENENSWGVSYFFPASSHWDQAAFNIQDSTSWMNTKSGGCIDLDDNFQLTAGWTNNKETHTQWNFHKVVSGDVTGVMPVASKVAIKQQILQEEKDTHQYHPITEIKRNQYITVVVNIYYSEKEDKFTFTTEPWTEKTEDMEFN